MIKVTIISGFLGAGKTTFINKMLTERVFGSERVLIVENEFGREGIDGDLLRGQGAQVRELSSGCICCSLNGDFREALFDILERETELRHLIIEPSGVGKLSSVLELLRTPPLDEKLSVAVAAVIVDVERFHLYLRNYGEFFKDQLMNAASILLTRTEKTEKLEAVRREIEKRNPLAEIDGRAWQAFSASDWWLEAQQDYSVRAVELIRSKGNGPSLSSLLLDASALWTEESLKRALTELAHSTDCRGVIRAKGIVPAQEGGFFRFDYVKDEPKFGRLEGSELEGRMVFIGSDLKEESLNRIFGGK